ncbi:hypothetical protein OS31_32970 [Dickeya oryzae]
MIFINIAKCQDTVTFMRKSTRHLALNKKVSYEHAIKRIIKESESQDLVDDLIYKIGISWLDKLRDNLKLIVNRIEENRNSSKKINLD